MAGSEEWPDRNAEGEWTDRFPAVGACESVPGETRRLEDVKALGGVPAAPSQLGDVIPWERGHPRPH